MAGERWWTGFKSIDQPCRSSEIKRNPKMSISFIWLESGGGWGSSPITSLADYQKLKVIQKQAFHFLAGEGWQMGAESIDQPGSLSDVKHNPKMSISFFFSGEGWQMGFESINQPCHSPEVEHNPKMGISFFGWRGVADEVWIHQPAQLIFRSWV